MKELKFICVVSLLLFQFSCLSISKNPVGVWESESGDSKYIFSSDHTFDHFLRIDENEVRHRKGKWTLSEDGGIFLRHFGSRHWPTNNDFNDRKIDWANYYILERDKIVDNQEDYENIWYKKEHD